MFVRKNIERSMRRSLDRLLLLTMCLYMSSALAQESAVDEAEPVQGDVSNTDTSSQPSAETSSEIIYKDQLPAEPENTNPGTAEQQAQDDVVESLSAETAVVPATDSRRIERFGSGSTEEWQMDLSVPTPPPTPRINSGHLSMRIPGSRRCSQKCATPAASAV